MRAVDGYRVGEARAAVEEHRQVAEEEAARLRAKELLALRGRQLALELVHLPQHHLLRSNNAYVEVSLEGVFAATSVRPSAAPVWNESVTLYAIRCSHSITFSEEGTFYYICEVVGHCSAGQKIAVTVVAPTCTLAPEQATQDRWRCSHTFSHGGYDVTGTQLTCV